MNNCPQCGHANRAGAKYCARCGSPANQQPNVWNYTPLAPGKTMKNGVYTVIRQLSKGGMGAICGHESAAASFPAACPACGIPQQQRPAADINLSPISINLGRVAVGQSASARIRISGTRGGDVRREIYTNCP